jgi:hypothetical protein
MTLVAINISFLGLGDENFCDNFTPTTIRRSIDLTASISTLHTTSGDAKTWRPIDKSIGRSNP